MCMKNTVEGCILLERMAKVETKLWFLITLVTAMFCVLTVITLKLLNSQIYLLSGADGAKIVAEQTDKDMQAIRHAVSE